MAFTKITQSELNSRGATTLDNTPQIGAQKLKEEFDAPAKQIVAPAVNRLVDELEADTGAMSLGANVPTGLPIGTQNNVQSILSALTIEVNKKEDTPENADVLNALSDVDGELFYGEQKMAKSSELPTKISELANDSNFIEDADYVHTDNNFTNEDKDSIANKVDKVVGKGLSTNDYTNDDKETLYGVAAELAEKVDKEPGKGLSANNYTNEDKTKLDGIEDGANNYVLPVATDSTLGGVKADGTTTEIEADGTIKVIGGGSGGASIDDTTTATDSVWSSEKPILKSLPYLIK